MMIGGFQLLSPKTTPVEFLEVMDHELERFLLAIIFANPQFLEKSSRVLLNPIFFVNIWCLIPIFGLIS